jgi:glycogen synthase
MTSRVEPFGLSGLEPLAAGVVPLVIETSGLAMHLWQYCGVLTGAGACSEPQ